MSNLAIKVENLSKAYQLGEIGTGTLSRDLERWWASIRGKEDPFLRIGETNDRSAKGTSNVVWSLKDLNLEIKQGDAVGIIGRNGAGKSTLLKILSRVTAPTTGSVKIKGRIASLLEVGTGFHPELTGRENIFLNGAILGMRKAEIKRKFDEIVDFAGVERYIDTPVKRYSSGMYVRLAFAVAAHLESEILIVDEVLAVGDAEFQKKCLGKMGEVSKGEGRTVLFVSHNMSAIGSLCQKGILLDRGILKSFGEQSTIIDHYNSLNITSNTPKRKHYFGQHSVLEILEYDVTSNDIVLTFKTKLSDHEVFKSLVIIITDVLGNRISLIDLREKLGTTAHHNLTEILIDHTPLVENTYYIGISIETSLKWYDLKEILLCEIPIKQTSTIQYEPNLRGYVTLSSSYGITC
ncbi:ABC transporter ATP-binding protein [Pedobacter hiemivivus]|uniref:ABC transporter ATP-binding protein n=1 Tax=Pedobacter hiemivivus TaxID=2530454 RepID=UPI001F45EBCC|nr:ABC transporter ATP-binding protein [Pedobacter hiemivivus]